MNSAHVFAQPYFFVAELLEVKAEFNVFAPALVICIEWMTSEIISTYELQSACALLRHQRNAGLAVARNTAFTAAKAAWCFVLDADNVLYPQAVSACLEVAGQMDDSVAVVHPLLLVEAEAGRPDERRSLVGLDSWQQSKFLRGNYIDAMALIRRSAWDKVGGYTHIEGGWEDYDFWCKLVEAGYHGVQCPQVLAVYRSHADSMTMHSTMRLQRPLSRTLQARHPWLELALARP